MHVFWNYFFSCNSNKDLYNVCCDFIIIQVFNQIPDTNTLDKSQEVKMNVQFMKKKQSLVENRNRKMLISSHNGINLKLLDFWVSRFQGSNYVKRRWESWIPLLLRSGMRINCLHYQCYSNTSAVMSVRFITSDVTTCKWF